MTQLVILVDYPISPVWLRYFRLPRLAGDFKVIYVEIKITKNQKKAFLSAPKFDNEIEGARIEVGDMRALVKVINHFDNAIVIDILALGLARYLWLNIVLRNKNCKIVKLIIGILPAQIKKVSFLKRVMKIFGETGLIKGVNRLISGVSVRIIKSLMVYDYSVLGGLAAGNLLPKHPGIVIESAGFDFIEYNKVQGYEKNETEFAVLIEENLVHDSDFILMGSQKDTDQNIYFNSLREYLLKLQGVTGIPIKVLPHPKSDRGRLKSYLPDFDQINENSALSISRARFVLTHASTAISFAVLAKKPIVLMKCAGLSAEVFNLMDGIASVLGIKPYEINELNVLAKRGFDHLLPSEDRRTSYIDSFVRHPQAKLFSFGEIVRHIRDARPG